MSPELEHLKGVLFALRKINRLTTKEKNRDRLLQKACDILIENRGYHSAFIVMLNKGLAVEPFYHAGFDGRFGPMEDLLRSGRLPDCFNPAIEQADPWSLEIPSDLCSSCPLTDLYDGRAALIMRLEHLEKLYGVLAVSMPRNLYHIRDEQELFRDICNDLAFDLWSFESEARRENVTKQYSLVVETTSNAVISTDLDGIITLFNPGAEKMFACSADEAQKSSISRFCPPELRDEQKKIHQQVIEKGNVGAYRTERMTLDGRRIPVEIMMDAIRDEQGQIQGSTAIIMDVSKQKQLEQELIASEQKYRALYENAPLSYHSLDEHGRFLDINPAWLRTLGYQRQEVVGKDYADFLHPEWKPHFQKNFQEFKRRGYISDVQFKLRHKQGHYIDVSFEGCVGYWPDGSFRQTYCVLKDITEQKNSEEALRKSEEFQRAIISASPLGIISLDPDGNVLSWNNAAENIFGWASEEVLYKPLPIIPEDQLEESLAMRRRVMCGKTFHQNEVMRRRKDGSNIQATISMSPIFNNEEKITGVTCIYEDITERKKSNEAVRQSELRYRSLFDQSIDGIVVHDLEGKIIDLNNVAATQVNFTRDELLGMNVSDFFVGADRDKVLELWSKLPMHDPLLVESSLRTKDGTIIPVEAKFAKVNYDDQVTIMAVIRDLTERLQAEKKREKLQAQLIQAQKMETVGRLAGGVAHDFNNMLGVILGFSELALDKIRRGEPLENELETIKKAAERSSMITRQLLAFSRQQTISPKALNLNENIESILKMLRRVISEDIDLVWQPGKRLWSVNMDPAQIDQVLVNICVNARDAISSFGKIIIKTENFTLDEAGATYKFETNPGDYVVLSVSDNGCGMDKEIQDHLFEPFFTTKETGKGTGLGLSTVFGIVKQNKGFINIYSEPGVGTTVKIYLPRLIVQEESESCDVGKLHHVRGSETILLVEDETMILEMTATMLESLGYDVLKVGRPKEALILAEDYEFEIHLLLTDVIMPEMNGRDLADEIRNLHPDLKALFMSGYPADVIADHGLLEDGISFLQKPFSTQDIANKVREVLDWHHSQSTGAAV